jgi:hypothetical protein
MISKILDQHFMVICKQSMSGRNEHPSYMDMNILMINLAKISGTHKGFTLQMFKIDKQT